MDTYQISCNIFSDLDLSPTARLVDALCRVKPAFYGLDVIIEHAVAWVSYGIEVGTIEAHLRCFCPSRYTAALKKHVHGNGVRRRYHIVLVSVSAGFVSSPESSTNI